MHSAQPLTVLRHFLNNIIKVAKAEYIYGNYFIQLMCVLTEELVSK